MKTFIKIIFDGEGNFHDCDEFSCKTDLPYVILGIRKDAQKKDVKKAYISLMQQFHPDKHSKATEFTREEMSEKTKLINWAYQELKNSVA